MKKNILTVFALLLAVAGGAQALERTTGASTSVGTSSTDALVKTLQEVMNAGFADLRNQLTDLNDKMDASLTCSRQGMVFNPEGENPDNDNCVKIKKLDCTDTLTNLMQGVPAPSRYDSLNYYLSYTDLDNNMVYNQLVRRAHYGSDVMMQSHVNAKHGSSISMVVKKYYPTSQSTGTVIKGSQDNPSSEYIAGKYLAWCNDGDVAQFSFVVDQIRLPPPTPEGGDVH